MNVAYNIIPKQLLKEKLCTGKHPQQKRTKCAKSWIKDQRKEMWINEKRERTNFGKRLRDGTNYLKGVAFFTKA